MRRLPQALSARAPRARTWLAAAASAAALTAGGCADNEVTFFIVQNQVPTPSGTSGMCNISSDPGALKTDQGTLDVILTDRYVLSPLYRSELISYRDPNAGRAETRGLFVEGAEISLHLNTPEGSLVVPSFTVSLSTFVPPGTTAAPGYGVGSLEVIPPQASEVLVGLACRFGTPPTGSTRPTLTSVPQRVVATVRPFGRTMGGTHVEGAVYTYPIDVCCGCLVQFPAGSDDPMLPGPDCRGGTASTLSCGVGQDVPVDCRLCSTNAYCSP